MSSAEQNHLENGLYYDEQTSDSLQVLLKNISSLNRAVELKTVLDESLDAIQSVMNVEASSLMLQDESTGELVVSMPTGPVRKEITGERLEEGVGIGGWVIKNGEPYYSNDPTNTDIFAGELSENFTTENIICVPLNDKRGDTFGVLQAINRLDDREFGDQDVLVFQSLADHVVIAIERTRELENMQNDLHEKEVMLTEIHHRLKNNLSTITALIEMELSNLEDEAARDVLRKTCSRIESMTEIHNLLYNANIGNHVNLKSYIERLTKKISDMLKHISQAVDIEVQAEPIQLETERALSCGLLLNELLVNSYKHAFNDMQETGHISIKLFESDDHYVTLKVSDDGTGIGDNFDPDGSSTIGSWLINVLLRRLDAAADISRNDGTTYLVRFKK